MLVIDVQSRLTRPDDAQVIALDPTASLERVCTDLDDALAQSTPADNSAYLVITQDPNWAHDSDQPQLVNCIASDGDTRYPQIHFRSPLAQTALRRPTDTARVIAIYDKLIRHQAAELVQCVVAPPNAQPATIQAALEVLATAMNPLREAKPSVVPEDVLNALSEGIHYTHSDSLQLARLCSRYHALFKRWPTASKARQSTARATLKYLESEIESFKLAFQ